MEQKILDAMKVYNRLFNNAIVKKHSEARSVLLGYHADQKAVSNYYKSSNKYDYYIEEPYESLTFTDKGVEFRHYSYDVSFLGRKDKMGWSGSFCLGLCGYSKENLIERIEAHIIEDNKEETK